MGLFGLSDEKCARCGKKLPVVMTGGDDRIDDLLKRSKITIPKYQERNHCTMCAHVLQSEIAAAPPTLDEEIHMPPTRIESTDDALQQIWSRQRPSSYVGDTGGQMNPGAELLEKAKEAKNWSVQSWIFIGVFLFILTRACSGS